MRTGLSSPSSVITADDLQRAGDEPLVVRDSCPHARPNARLFLAWCFVLDDRSLSSQAGKFQTWILRFHKSDIHGVDDNCAVPGSLLLTFCATCLPRICWICLEGALAACTRSQTWFVQLEDDISSCRCGSVMPAEFIA